MIEDILAEVGVQVVSVSNTEILAYCPVHVSVKGHAQDKPKWYMNSETGAWICFTCGQRGSLPGLVEALGGDPEQIEHLRLTAAVNKAHRLWGPQSGELPEEPVIINPEVFDANPRPSVKMMLRRDVTPEIVEAYNARWDREGKCWLLPIYTFDHQLAGWQEKSKGYFNNVPIAVKKSLSLFGWHTYRGGPLVVVESPLDAMRFAAHGHPAVAVYGSFPSAEQIEHLGSADKLIVAFDNDDAGDHARDELTKALASTHPHMRWFRYPKRTRGSDPGELTVEQLHRGITAAMYPKPKEREHVDRPTKRPPPRHPQLSRSLF